MRTTGFLAAIAWACALGVGAANAASGDWDLRLVCGGIGSDEREAMEAKAPSANLSLEMFIAPGGEYVADVDVTLQPLGGERAPLAVHTEGPICLLHVPPGRYRIEATFSGVTRSAQTTVPAGATRPVRVALAFPKSVGDRQTDAASPEERQQAAKP
jgi:hypothetical protein